MKGKNSKYSSGCTDAVNSKCVVWNGPAIPCLSICHDDVLTDVVHAVADRVCELVGETDMSTLDLNCIIDLCDSCPTDKSLKSVLQLMLENQCSLKELIDDIIAAINSGSSGGGAIVLTLDMKCLEILDAFGNPVEQDVNQTFQSIINELCNHKTRITTLETTVVDLQDQIDNIDTGTGTGPAYNPPTVTIPADCLGISATTMDADDAVQPTINALCDLKTVLGDNADLSTSIGRQCTNLNTIYGLTPNWELNPSTVADTLNNMWIMTCDMLNRVKTIETTCCAPSCKDIKIGFSAEYDPAENTFVITFDSANGTEIPLGFTDCGTTITFTDKLNHSKTSTITIIQGESVVVSASGLNLTDLISVSIKTCFEHISGLKCNDCFGGVVSAESACAYCKLCAQGGVANTDFVEVMYQLDGQGTIYSKKITTGECLYFESKYGMPVITSLWYSSSDISLESDDEHPCTAVLIPTPTPDTCWFFGVPLTSHIDMYINQINQPAPPLPNYQVRFDTSGNTGSLIPRMTWKKMYDIHNLSGATIGGDVEKGGSTGNDTINVLLPTGLPSNVLSSCLNPGAIGYDFRLQGEPNGDDTMNITGSNPNRELGYTFYDKGTGKIGFTLTLKAQPSTNIPTLVYHDPISGNDSIIQGTLVTDCQCAD